MAKQRDVGKEIIHKIFKENGYDVTDKGYMHMWGSFGNEDFDECFIKAYVRPNKWTVNFVSWNADVFETIPSSYIIDSDYTKLFSWLMDRAHYWMISSLCAMSLMKTRYSDFGNCVVGRTFTRKEDGKVLTFRVDVPSRKIRYDWFEGSGEVDVPEEFYHERSHGKAIGFIRKNLKEIKDKCFLSGGN